MIAQCTLIPSCTHISTTVCSLVLIQTAGFFSWQRYALTQWSPTSSSCANYGVQTHFMH